MSDDPPIMPLITIVAEGYVTKAPQPEQSEQKEDQS